MRHADGGWRWILARGKVVDRGTEGEALRLERRGKKIHASGHLTLVPFARWANRIVTIGVLDGVDHVLSLPVKDLIVDPAQDFAGMPRDDIELDYTLTETDVTPLPRPVGGMRGLGALIRSLATTGAMETILKMSVQYANDRVQFKEYEDLTNGDHVTHAFYVKYLLPIWFDIQCFERGGEPQPDRWTFT
mgnify:CR=1 FL=1